jgi:hypothetical protein
MFLSNGGTIPTFSAKQLPMIAPQDFFHHSGAVHGLDESVTKQADGVMGCGDPVTHYYVVEDLLKLDPKSILWLYDHSQKWQVERYLDSLGDWFCNNGDTLSETLRCVLERREADHEISGFGIIEKD